MKSKLLKFLIFVVAATLLYAASSRIKDLSSTATTVAGDDYIAIDGTTNGTRKILATYLYGNGTGTGNGTVTGAASSVDNRLVTWNSTTGTSIKDGTNITATANTVTSSGNITLVTATSNNIVLTPGTGGIVSIPGNATVGNVTTGGFDFSAASAVVGVWSVANGGTGLSTATANRLILGNGTGAMKNVAGITSDGTSAIVLGVDATTAGSIKLFGGTSGNVTLAPTAAAGSGVTMTIPAATDTFVGKATTDTLTNKTFDAAGTGNVLKQKGYIYLTHPHLADGTNATIGTTATSIAYGHATFSNSVDEASNYVEYYIQVPEDIDTSVALRGRLKILLGNTDTGTHRYVLSTVSVADSAVPTSSTLANAINIDFAGDGSGASGDVETSAWTTLTSWAGALTAGQTWRIRLARDGNATQDGSTVNSTELGLVIEYGITQ